MKYNLVIEEVVETTRESKVSVESDSIDNALTKIQFGDYEVNDSKILLETEHIIEPTFKTATIKVYDENNNLIWDNKIPEIF